jgi:hypothetical protein
MAVKEHSQIVGSYLSRRIPEKSNLILSALQSITLILLVSSITLALSARIPPGFAGLVFCITLLAGTTSRHYASNIINTGFIHESLLTFIRYPGYGLFFLAIGIKAFLLTEHRIYIFAVPFSFFLWGYVALLMARHATNNSGELSELLEPSGLRNFRNTTNRWWDRYLLGIFQIIHSWITPLLILVLGIANMPGILFLTSSILVVAIIAFKLRLLSLQGSESAQAASRSGTGFLLYMFGVSILLLLITGLPFADVIEAIQVVGPDIMLLLIVPAVWVIPYAMTLKILLNNRVSFQDALYTQVSGDAFNSITPLLGLGGEPYKAKHLSNFVSLEDASRAIVQSRLIHALSGVLFAAIVISITVLVVDLSRISGFATGLSIVAAIMFTVSLLLIWVTMSRVPTRITGLVLSRFKIIEDFQHARLPWSTLWLALIYKLSGRSGKFLELYVIFRVLDIVPTFADMMLVEAMIMASISIFFFVPQGIGVNEAGIVTAFTIAGYAAATGIAFGLIRRARMVVYALFGLAVYILGKAVGFGQQRYRTNTTR